MRGVAEARNVLPFRAVVGKTSTLSFEMESLLPSKIRREGGAPLPFKTTELQRSDPAYPPGGHPRSRRQRPGRRPAGAVGLREGRPRPPPKRRESSAERPGRSRLPRRRADLGGFGGRCLGQACNPSCASSKRPVQTANTKALVFMFMWISPALTEVLNWMDLEFTESCFSPGQADAASSNMIQHNIL